MTWLPTEIAGLELWLDAADAGTITESGGAVSEWRDKSGNDRHATQPTEAAQPTYDAANDRVVFASDWLQVASGPAVAAMFMVVSDIIGGTNGGARFVTPLISDGADDDFFLFAAATSGTGATFSVDGTTGARGDGSVNGSALVPGNGTGMNFAVAGYSPFPRNAAADIVFAQWNTITPSVTRIGAMRAGEG